MAENFPNLGKETNIKIQEAQRVPNKNSKQNMGEGSCASLAASSSRLWLLEYEFLENNRHTVRSPRDVEKARVDNLVSSLS